MTYGCLLDLKIFFGRQEVMQCPCQRLEESDKPLVISD
jgi:hypothetical protein